MGEHFSAAAQAAALMPGPHCRTFNGPPFALSCPVGVGAARTEERRRGRRRVVRVVRCILRFERVCLVVWWFGCKVCTWNVCFLCMWRFYEERFRDEGGILFMRIGGFVVSHCTSCYQ